VAAPGLSALRAAVREPRMRIGMWLMGLPAIGFGVMNVLVPLRLDELGAGAVAIGAAFLVAVFLESLMSPLVGRMADRRGALWPARIGLVSGGLAFALLPLPRSALLVGAGVAVAAPLLGMLWAPAMSLLSDGAESRGIDPAFGFGLANLAWGTGATFGGTAGGAVAQATADAVPFAAVAAGALATAVVVSRAAQRSAAGHAIR
jgi:MFS family permease